MHHSHQSCVRECVCVFIEVLDSPFPHKMLHEDLKGWAQWVTFATTRTDTGSPIAPTCRHVR